MGISLEYDWRLIALNNIYIIYSYYLIQQRRGSQFPVFMPLLNSSLALWKFTTAMLWPIYKRLQKCTVKLPMGFQRVCNVINPTNKSIPFTKHLDSSYIHMDPNTYLTPHIMSNRTPNTLKGGTGINLDP